MQGINELTAMYIKAIYAIKAVVIGHATQKGGDYCHNETTAWY